MKNVVGLNKQRRIDWSIQENISLVGLVLNSGLHAKVIGEHCGGMTVGQVYNRCHKLGIKITDYRNGLTESSKVILKRYTVISSSDKKEVTTIIPKLIKKNEKS